MRQSVRLLALAAIAGPALAAGQATVPVPPAITADGVPAIPTSLADSVRPYLEARSAGFQGWDTASRGMLITTRFANAAQLHRVLTPGAAREQLTFEADPIAGASADPAGSAKAGATVVVSKDVGGGEFFQLYRLDHGRLVLLTDGKSRNTGGLWSRDGRLVGYASTRGNGTDSDLYILDPRDPKSDRLALKTGGVGWDFRDFSADGRKALVEHGVSVEKSELFELDLASAKLTRLTPEGRAASYNGAHYLANGTILTLSDDGADMARLGIVSREGRFTPLGAASRWEVESYAVSPDGRIIAYTTNEDGFSRLHVMDATGRALAVPALPAGVITGLDIAPWGEIGFSLESATSPADAWSVVPGAKEARRWTHSETGGLDPSINSAPELVRVKSFDGLEVTGLLYRPDPKKFPGKRPLIFQIHGGPEGQSRAVFQQRNNYLLNELGIAVFFPNVRGSTGYGKRFVSLDNGPFRREDSVKDIGAFLDRLAADPGIDPARIAETGGSYGGYMCYASAIRYGTRFRSALCTVAISNFLTFLQNTQSYRRDLRRVEYGDERDPVQRAKLEEISPLTRVKELRIPLMVVTGGNDPRVPPSEAEQMVKAVRANGVPVWHVLAADEGHGYRKKANVDYNFLATLTFWQQTLLKDR